MAVNLNDPNRLNQQQQQGQPAGAQPMQQNQQKPRTSGFTNIQRVLGANQGNKLGQTISSGVQSVVGGAKANIDQQAQANKTIADNYSSKLGENKTKADTALSQINSAEYQAPAPAPQGANQPAVLSKTQQFSGLNPEQIAQQNQAVFTDLLNKQYEGPQSLQNYDKLQSQTQDAQYLGSQLGSQNRQGLLQRFIGGTNYGLGKQRLDNLLLGQSASSELTGAKREANLLGNKLNEAQQGAIGQYLNNMSAGKAAKDDILQKVGKSKSDIETDVDKQLKALTEEDTGNAEKINTLNTVLNDPAKFGVSGSADNIAIEALKRAGINSPQIAKLITKATQEGFDPIETVRKYAAYTKGTGLTKENMLTATQAAKLNALNSLTGSVDKTYDPNAAGKFEKSNFRFDDAAVKDSYKQKLFDTHSDTARINDYQNRINNFNPNLYHDPDRELQGYRNTVRYYQQKRDDEIKQKMAELDTE